MKFITKKGAPDIPLEVLEARDDDRLVIFCGAGISYKAGLKTFKGLVDQVYSSLPDTKTDLEEEAYKQGHYDSVLELLERRYFSEKRADNFLVRKKIIENLTIKPGADLSSHKAILELAQTKNGKVRLVTTNVDLGFQLADPTTQELTDTAPKLPVPKPYKWNSLVHLHGVINDSLDPNGENFVFTSGDFGTAYLTERWASRFVGELFRNFTVLFVGYGINDPVIRYMTDAIAAERRKGDLHFLKPFILAATNANSRSKDLEIWRTKGVEPILYNAGKAHTYLHQTLSQWAIYCADGMRAKERIIGINSRIPPLPPFEDDQTKQVIDTLKERSNIKANDLTGIPAKIFAEYDPVPSIEWLPALEKHGLLNIFSMPPNPRPVSIDPTRNSVAEPNKPSRWLWNWLACHLESEELVHWVISNGGCLHPDFSIIIQKKLTGKTPPKEPSYTYWNYTVNRKSPCSSYYSFATWRLLDSFKRGVTLLDLHNFLHGLRPRVKFSKPISFYEDTYGSSTKRLYSAEVVVQVGEEHLFEEIEKLDNYPDIFVPILLEISLLLKSAMEMSDELGIIDQLRDRSHWDMPSISPHKQNRRYNSWVVLVELCRDVWQAAWGIDQRLANLVLEIWQSISFPIFKRLVLHAYSIDGVVAPSKALDYLLSDDGWWLWAIETEREKYRLLNVVWPLLSDSDVDRLINRVISGPPRGMYRGDLSDDEWLNSHDRAIWKLLSKLIKFGRDLNDEGHNYLSRLSTKYPQWRLRGGERDEFSHWMESGTWGEESDIKIVDLIDSEVSKIREVLSEKSSKYYSGRLDVFRSFCKQEVHKALDFIEYMSLQDDWNYEVWHAALGSLNGDKLKQFSRIAVLLKRAPDHFYAKESWAIASWVKKVIDSVEQDTEEEEFFWHIFISVITSAPQADIKGESDVLTAAINDSIGMMAEALITRFGSRKFDHGEGISDGYLRNSINMLISGIGGSFILGRVILASRLHYFHAIDPVWSKENLISKMSWAESTEAKYLWEGYLWMPRITADLVLDFKDEFLLTINNASISESGKEHLFQLTTIILLQLPDSFTKNEKIAVLRDVGLEGRAVVADFLLQSYRDNGDNNEEKVSFWRNRLRPLFKSMWPKDAESISSATSESLALIAIHSGEMFSEAVDTITPLLGPIDGLYMVVRDLQQSDLSETYPEDVIRLLGLVFKEGNQYPMTDFRDLLNRLSESDANISTTLVYRQIDAFLLQCNQ